MTTKAAFLTRVRAVAAAQGVDLPGREAAERATGAVFQTLHRRITPLEADQVAAQLPRDLERLWQGSWLQGLTTALRGPERWNRAAFYAQVGRLGRFPANQVPAVVAAVFTALRESLSAGEADDVHAQLPVDLKPVWAGANLPPDLVVSHEEGYAEGLVGEVPAREWRPFLAGLAAHYRDAPVRVVIETPDGRCNPLSTRLPLLGLEPEIEPDGVRAIDVALGETSGRHPAHLVHRALQPRRLLLQVDAAGYARLLNIESDDGSRTLVHFAA